MPSVHFSDFLIVLFCLIAWCWNLPAESGLRWMISPLSPLVQWLGLWHDWRMFAPNPLRVNRRTFVRIGYDDGTVREWQPPSTADVGWWKAFQYARVRKFCEFVHRGRPEALRISLAYYVLVRMQALSEARPVLVEVIGETWPISIDQHPTQQPPRRSQQVLYHEVLPVGGAA